MGGLFYTAVFMSIVHTVVTLKCHECVWITSTNGIVNGLISQSDALNQLCLNDASNTATKTCGSGQACLSFTGNVKGTIPVFTSPLELDLVVTYRSCTNSRPEIIGLSTDNTMPAEQIKESVSVNEDLSDFKMKSIDGITCYCNTDECNSAPQGNIGRLCVNEADNDEDTASDSDSGEEGQDDNGREQSDTSQADSSESKETDETSETISETNEDDDTNKETISVSNEDDDSSISVSNENGRTSEETISFENGDRTTSEEETIEDTDDSDVPLICIACAYTDNDIIGGVIGNLKEDCRLMPSSVTLEQTTCARGEVCMTFNGRLFLGSFLGDTDVAFTYRNCTTTGTRSIGRDEDNSVAMKEAIERLGDAGDDYGLTIKKLEGIACLCNSRRCNNVSVERLEKSQQCETIHDLSLSSEEVDNDVDMSEEDGIDRSTNENNGQDDSTSKNQDGNIDDSKQYGGSLSCWTCLHMSTDNTELQGFISDELKELIDSACSERPQTTDPVRCPPESICVSGRATFTSTGVITSLNKQINNAPMTVVYRNCSSSSLLTTSSCNQNIEIIEDLVNTLLARINVEAGELETSGWSGVICPCEADGCNNQRSSNIGVTEKQKTSAAGICRPELQILMFITIAKGMFVRL